MDSILDLLRPLCQGYVMPAATACCEAEGDEVKFYEAEEYVLQ